MGTVPPGPTFAYVMASVRPLDGIAGAEFRVRGLPSGWRAFSTANPAANILLGDPLDAIGVDMGFATCQTPACVLLFELAIFPTTSQTGLVLDVCAKAPPSNPYFYCPLVILCDDPYFTAVCVLGRCSGGGGGGNSPPIALRERSWSEVKLMYRDATR